MLSHNLSIITSDIGIEEANTRLAPKYGRERCLDRALRKYRDLYDYIIIDSNPSLSITTINVIVASDYILIPFKPEFNSFKGIDLLLDSVTEIQRDKPEIGVLGYVVTMADPRRRSTREAVEYVRSIAEERGGRVFHSEIRVGVAAADAPSYGKSILEYAPNSGVAADYEHLCDEILKTLEMEA